jgi:hypothetical protein
MIFQTHKRSLSHAQEETLEQPFSRSRRRCEGWSRLLLSAALLGGLLATTSCGSSSKQAANPTLSGNWQITLSRHASTQPQIYSGFLVQSGSAIAGSVVLGGGCSGVGPVIGKMDGENLSLTINQFGQDLTLTGSVPSASGFLGGDFSTLAGACNAFPNTGTWTAIEVPPLAGTFHGTFTSAGSGSVVNVTGTIAQGPNTGNSNASLNGTVTTTGSAQFCDYLTVASINGLISGTTVTLGLFGPEGTQITQIPASIAPDGTSLTGNYSFQGISSSCTGDTGIVQLMFP